MDHQLDYHRRFRQTDLMKIPPAWCWLQPMVIHVFLASIHHVVMILASFPCSDSLFSSSIGDRRWPQLQPHISNKSWRLGPGHCSAIPHRSHNREAVSSQGAGLRGSRCLHLHVYFGGPGLRGNHASWTSLCNSPNNGECVGVWWSECFSVSAEG